MNINMNIANNVGKIDVFNTLYDIQNLAFLNNNFILNNDNISYSNIFDHINYLKINIIKILLLNNNNIDIIKNKFFMNGDTILHYITYYFIKYSNNNYYENFKFLIKNYIDINKKNLYGYSILYGVCKYHYINFDLIKFLLENGSNPNLSIECKLHSNVFSFEYNSPENSEKPILAFRFISVFTYVCIKFYNIVFFQNSKIELYFNIIKEMVKYGGNIYEKIIVKRIIDTRMDLDSFSPYVTQNEEITIIDLFDEIEPEYNKDSMIFSKRKYKDIILKSHREYVFNKRLPLLLMIEGCDKNYRLPKIFENEDLIKELCSFI